MKITDAFPYNDSFALIKQPEAFLYEENGIVSDEVLSGYAVRIIPSPMDNEILQDSQKTNKAADHLHQKVASPYMASGQPDGSRIYVETFYGYRGWADPDVLLPISRLALAQREDSGTAFVVTKRMADLLSRPSVKGAILETLSRGSIVTVCRKKSAPAAGDSYTLVQAADGRTGFIASSSLMPRQDSDAYFLQDHEDQDYFLHQKSLHAIPEEKFRENVTKTAMSYLGVQYRWGGTSGAGIDCSGLVSMSYRMNGVLIFRDAKIRKEYPIHEIPWETKKPGDLMFMKGHVAMYLGDQKYIHSTGYARDFGCVLASLDPDDPAYRSDLVGKWLCAGSIFSVA